MGERYGYVRVSTKDQHPDRQIENIKKHYPDIKDDNLFIEKISGKKGMDERDEYAVLRRIVRSGDELVIDALDRLGRKKTDIKAELEYLKTKGATDIKTCTLLDKPDRRTVDFTPDYYGKIIPDEFVVGFGLDYDERFRNLPYIGILKPSVYSK